MEELSTEQLMMAWKYYIAEYRETKDPKANQAAADIFTVLSKNLRKDSKPKHQTPYKKPNALSILLSTLQYNRFNNLIINNSKHFAICRVNNNLILMEESAFLNTPNIELLWHNIPDKNMPPSTMF